MSHISLFSSSWDCVQKIDILNFAFYELKLNKTINWGEDLLCTNA